MRRADRRVPALAVLLVLATVAAYARVLGAGFLNFDDPSYVTENPHVRRGLGLAGVRWAFAEARETSLWHPLTWLSHMLDVTLFGLDPAGHHATSLALHAVNGVLLFLVLRGMTGALWRSAAVAALFALHPLRVESVAWVAERKDLLCALFGLLAVGAHARYAARPGTGRGALVAVAFTLGLLAKPMLVTLPLLLLLLDWWPLRRLGPRRASAARCVREKLPLFVLAAAAAVLTLIVARRTGAAADLVSIPLGARAANAVVSYARYLGKLAWPSGLAVFYPLPAGWPPLAVAGAGALLVALTFAAIALRARRPHLLVGWLWFVIALLPVSGLVQTGPQAMADRFTYLPAIGVFLAVVWEAHAALRSRPRLAGALAAAALAALGAATWRQVGHWESTRTLFAHALGATSDNWLAHNNLGDALLREGRMAEAREHFVEALRLRPAYPDAHYNLGVALALQGRFAKAAEEFRTSVVLRPGYAPAQYNLGLALHRLGRGNEAIAHYREALRLAPDHAEAHYGLALLLAAGGDEAGAAPHFDTARRLRPTLPPPATGGR